MPCQSTLACCFVGPSMRTATSVSEAARSIRRAVRCNSEMNNPRCGNEYQGKSQVKRPSRDGGLSGTTNYCWGAYAIRYYVVSRFSVCRPGWRPRRAAISGRLKPGR
jgi:hypothetical protein